MVEQSAVNRSVASSSLACGAIYGELSERSKEHDWKSCRRLPLSQGFESLALRQYTLLYNYILWPLGQAVKTPPFHGGNTGSNPVGVTIFGGLAQLGEHLPYKQRVGGSIPSSSTIFSIIAGWSSSVARRAHNPKVAGSNPAPAIVGPVVQLVRMPACHAGGRGFESRPDRHLYIVS